MVERTIVFTYSGPCANCGNDFSVRTEQKADLPNIGTTLFQPPPQPSDDPGTLTLKEGSDLLVKVLQGGAVGPFMAAEAKQVLENLKTQRWLLTRC